MTAKPAQSTRLTREERQALLRLREYLAQFKAPGSQKPLTPQSGKRQVASV